ncbi:hypothetical protein QWI18_25015 [Pseudomonas sp. W2Oct36]|uniref:hypothetical protein n=1 Tax=Pseudomonas TaxID=286 RepID=UPI0001E29CC9|nr:hypothetical protein [Pseudomonas viridiflava]
MTNVFIVGLPQSEQSRVESKLLKRQIKAHIIPCGWGNQGEYVLLPHPSCAIHALWQYCETIGEGFKDARIFVLPFALLPENVADDLIEMADMGANVVCFEQEKGGWPFLKRHEQLDQPKANAATKLLLEAIGGEEKPENPSAYIAEAVANCPRLVVVSSAVDTCDEVSKQRYRFIRDGIDALVEIIGLEGKIDGTMEEFFNARKLKLAQSGGDLIELEVFQGGKSVHKDESCVHLKKGDATTPQNCPRIYFQAVDLASGYYVFLLYVGPHREGDFEKTHYLDST